MAAPQGAKKPGSAPAKAKKGESRQVYAQYEIQGESIKRKNVSCPKCGPGVFMANHPNRVSCGACGYTEFKKKQ